MRRAGEDAGILVIWVDMLRFDSEKAATKASGILDDSRVKQFWDPKNLVPEILGRGFDWEEGDPAWDIYLYYSPEATWGDDPPEPVAYFHQLSKHQDDEEHFFTGAALIKRLGKATEKYLETPIAAERSE